MKPPPAPRRRLEELFARRIVLLDGAMGSLIQTYKLQEADYRGRRFAGHPRELKGDNDLLVLTRPDLIRDIHHAYLAAGSDLIETNTFNATAVSQADYGLESLAYEINRRAAELAREACDAWSTRTPERPRFVAGAMGPTSKTLSLSPRVEDPGYRALSFAEMRDAYAEQARGLIDGGADLLLIETIFDTLNAKAAILACLEVFDRKGVELPLMISVTVTDQSGRTLSGQTLEAFWISVAHARPLSVGLNCALGAREMRPHLAELASLADCPVHCYPNAGLPNAFGEYDETPETMAGLVAAWAGEGLVNLVGGCCGTTPAHVAALAQAVAGKAPRRRPESGPPYTRLSGLEPLTIRPDSNFILIGERTNVTGSKRFARLIQSGDYGAALEVARDQVRGGANLLDVNMDEGLLDGPAAMRRFLNLLAAEPEIARLPIMIDSSKWEVLEAGLQCVQGKGVVNSISLKDGEEAFLDKARRVRRYGAGVVVMAFDEQGQAASAERKVEICRRAYRLLTERAGFAPQDVVFDPNVLAIATGIEEHDGYARSFLEAAREIKRLCPGAKLSGGISNLSFSFRGNETVREAIHAVFLYHAIAAGLDLGIVNAGQLAVYEDIPQELLERIEDLIFQRRPDATERLVAYAENVKGGGRKRAEDAAWRRLPVGERLRHALIHGFDQQVAADAAESLRELGDPLAVIEGPLMDGMRVVGDLFGAGKMFLPQVVKSARVMKKAVAWLTPHLEARDPGRQAAARATIVLATVKGDVHDIGKNIVGVVLRCNHYEVIDLGVMVPCETILRAAEEHGAALLGLSGLITPSLDEMVHVAAEMERRGMSLPLLIGGATTSRQHTAVKIAPAYSSAVVHVLDASRAVQVAAALLDPGQRAALARDNRAEQERQRALFAGKRDQPLLPLAAARANRPRWEPGGGAPAPPFLGRRVVELPLSEVAGCIDWTFFFQAWELRGRFPQLLDDPRIGAAARELYDHGRELLERLLGAGSLRGRAVHGFWPAAADGDDLLLLDPAAPARRIARFPMLRQQAPKEDGKPNLCLADWLAPLASGERDYLGAFAVTAGLGAAELVAEFEAEHDEYSALLVKALADRLAEAAAEWLHQQVRRSWYAPDERLSLEELLRERYRGIRPAFGYPACPDHSWKRGLFDLLAAEEIGMSLTESGAMLPPASVSGLYLAHPEARYFAVGRIGRDQLADYASRCGLSAAEAERRLGAVTIV